MRPNKDKECPKTNLGEPFLQSNSFVLKRPSLSFFPGYSSRYEAELAVFVESFSSSSGTNMGSKYSLSHAIFSETVYTVENQIQGLCQLHLVLVESHLHKICINIIYPCNIFLQTRVPIITHILLMKIIGVFMMLAKYLLE